MARILKSILRLDANSARRAAKDLTGDLKDVDGAGTSAMGNATAGARSFAGALVGAAAGVTAVVALMEQFRQQQVAIDAAQNAAFNAHRDRMRTLSGELGGDLYRQAFDILKMTPTQARRFGDEMAVRFDVTPDEALGMALPIGSRMGRGQFRGATEDAAMLATAGGAGVAAGELIPLVHDLYGGKTRPEWRQGAAQIRAVAQESGYTTDVFATQLGRLATPLGKAGMGMSEQASLLSAMSVYFPGATGARLATTTLRQLSRLSLKLNPFMRQILQAAGTPDSRNMMDIVRAVGLYAERNQNDPDAMQRLQESTEMPMETIEALMTATSEQFMEKYERSLGLAGGASWEAIEREHAEWMADPSTKDRVSAAVAQGGRSQRGEPGSLLESTGILGRAMGFAQGAPGYQEGLLAFSVQVQAQQGLDQPPDKEATARLFQLNRLYPNVRMRLLAIWTASGGVVATEGRSTFRVGGNLEAGTILSRLVNARRDANEWHFFGSQAQYIDGYENAMRDAIRFIRQAQEAEGEEGVAAQGVPGMEGGGARLPLIGGVGDLVPGLSGGSITNIGTFFNLTPQEAATNTETRTGE